MQFETKSPLVCEPIFLVDENGVQALTVLCKATLEIRPDGRLVKADTQLPVQLAGDPATEADQSSYRFEPETAPIKLATDVVLVGTARSHSGPATHLDVGLKVGQMSKVVRIFGDRWWIKRSGQIVATKPQPFSEMPLLYERAFGGWDKADSDSSAWRCEPRNPVGVGFGDPLRFVGEGKSPLPNIEDPNDLIRRYGDTPPPAGFGFISPNWHPRTQYAGTYDERWEKTRKPLLPDDFDRRFFSAASPGLVASGYLRGDEDVMIVNASSVPKLRFKLPSIPTPVCKIELRSGSTEILRTNFDTLIIDSDAMLVFLLWRNRIRVPNGPHDVVAITVTSEGALEAKATA